MSMLPDTRQAVRPDAVFNSQGEAASDKPFEAVNPCPHCGAVPHDAPEGVNVQGDPHWQFPHCFKCGFMPSVNGTSDRAAMQTAFAQFWQDRQSQQGDALSHPSVNADRTPITNPYADRLGTETAANDSQPQNTPWGRAPGESQPQDSQPANDGQPQSGQEGNG